MIAVTMPCFGTTERTRDNAVELAERLGATLRRIDIGAAVRQHFKDIGQSMDDHDVTFENSQARERTQVLMDVANQCGGLVVGTGDLSELALGWATYNGDHMSMYSVNASIPKTLVRRLVSYVPGTRRRRTRPSPMCSVISWTPRFPRRSCRHRGADRPEDRGSGGPLRAARLLPLLCHPLGLPATEGAPAG